MTGSKGAPGGQTPYEVLGGIDKVTAIIDDLVDRLGSDLIIGFHFRRVNLERLKRFEVQHAQRLLGGPDGYAGRPLDIAHARHRILGGHFDRRQTLLRGVLDAHGVPPAIRDAWLAHDEALRPLITNDRRGQCSD